jgi:hypothetical protein
MFGGHLDFAGVKYGECNWFALINTLICKVWCGCECRYKVIQLQSVVDFTYAERVLTKSTMGTMFILVGTFYVVYWLFIDILSISIIVIFVALRKF